GFDRLREDVEARGELRLREVPTDRTVLHRRTVESRPDLRAAAAARERASADLALARANAWCDVTPQVQYQRIGNDNPFRIGVSISLRVFYRNQGEIARTRAELDRVRALRDVVLTQALAEVDAALGTLIAEREKLRVLREVYLPR